MNWFSIGPNFVAAHYAAMKKDPHGPMAERARRLRKAMGYDYHGGQKAFADSLGINPDLWNHYEKGFRISQTSAEIVAQKFPGVHPSWLLWGDPRLLSMQAGQLLGETSFPTNGTTEPVKTGS